VRHRRLVRDFSKSTEMCPCEASLAAAVVVVVVVAQLVVLVVVTKLAVVVDSMQ
jgi:hypothetical protein